MPSRRPKAAKPSTIDQIKPNEIIERLRKHIHNHPNKRNVVANYMEPSQVTAAVALLKKVLPDLAAHKVDLSGDVRIEVLQVADHKTTK